jgi:hypothetical protein
MEGTPVIAGLLEKRAEIETAIAALERQIRVRRLGDCAIGCNDLHVRAVRHHGQATKFKRSVHFLTTELTRLCLDSLRQADGGLVTARETAARRCIKKGLDAGDGELLANFTKRIAWALAWMLGRGVVTKQGYGGVRAEGAAQGS